jgi:hypothetical protein
LRTIVVLGGSQTMEALNALSGAMVGKGTATTVGGMG